MAEYCKIQLTDWKYSTGKQQIEIIDAFLDLTVNEMSRKKKIEIHSISEEAVEEMRNRPEDKQLSLDLESELPMIPWAKLLKRKATLLINDKVKSLIFQYIFFQFIILLVLVQISEEMG